MSEAKIKRVLSFVLSTTMLLTLGCGKDTLNTGNGNFYDPNQANQYNPDNAPSDLSRRAVDGIRPKVVIKNMFFRVDKETGASVEDLFGELASKNINDPVNFDDVASFNVIIHQAKLILDGQNMNNVMKNYVLNYPDAPLSEMQHTIEAGNRLTIKGKMRKAGLKIPFEMSGTVRPTPDGLMMLTPDSIKTIGIPSKGLMDFLGLETQKLINVNEQRGMKVVGSNIILYPGRMFPPPTIQGKVSRIETESNKLIIYFDDNTKINRPPLPIDAPEIKNYQHVYGGAARIIGNETHENTNLMMIDMDQSNPFDFSMSEYYNHLLAGQVNAINRYGTLLTFMPDYNDIQKRINKMPYFAKVDSNLSGMIKQNPQSNPKLDKQRGISNQTPIQNLR